METPRITVVGSINVDMTVFSSRLPRPGETVSGGRFVQAGGGKGANQAVAAARAGAETTMVGRVGSDNIGKEALRDLMTEGIDTDFVVVDNDHATGIALIMVDRNGENAISVAPGANRELEPVDVERAKSLIEESDATLLQLEVPMRTAATVVDLARDGLLVLDPAPVPEEGIPAELFPHVSVLTPNLAEARRITGCSDSEGVPIVARALLALGVEAVAITMGEGGAYIHDGEKGRLLNAAPAHVVDTVGAGDSFAAALAVGMAEGQSLQDSARFALCAAAITTEREGAQPSLPSRRDIEQRMKSYRLEEEEI